MSSIEQVYLLVADELNSFLNQKVSHSYQGHVLHNIDNFLVDGRRQLRIWDKDKRNLDFKVKQRSDHLVIKKEGLQTARKAKNNSLSEKLKSEIEKLKSDIKAFEKDIKSINKCNGSILKGLEKLEEVAQNIRQKEQCQTNQRQQELNDLIVDFEKINIS
jgi:uncharacterized phage infection (PIP) family protein YhgE